MRLYEGMFIISDTVAGSDWEAAVKHVEDLLKNRGAEILKSEKWEDRKFAYKLKGHKRGAYLLIYFNAPTDSISLIKRDFELSDNVLRTLIVKVDKIKESKPVEESQADGDGTDAENEEADSTPSEPVASE
ncbi:MAG: 30S ribosomal protein S6 [Candidatus Scalindua rubra]|uniref:Small ribosomal subunit protein bS6 n=1 Tax=Candidatus Scalindua brodae TaxID=237368 RepID=A0A0B0EIG6_9BACT|nr:MAG: putative 30S ribosomal protein S6 [Candidatus Scalindua brodae]MBZ0109249.1 30S ribosomal protein S6 [Candidatus Scalindua rubra]TWU36832.1 30S ribosomal protein S6 [Candidatus Brocadiaceae bacterium S225]